MTKHKQPPIEVKDREQEFEKLLRAMGMNETDPHGEYALKTALEQIALDCQLSFAGAGKSLDPKRVQQLRKAIEKVLTLHKAAGAGAFDSEIALASLSRLNPDADASTLRMLIADYGRGRGLGAELTQRLLDIDHWLAANRDDYRKRQVRKVVVEPFLQLMTEYEIATSRKERPRKQIFDALFDWIGVEPKFRPSNANINTIAAELIGAGPSKSNANRRTKK